ncbi:MAG: zinc ribbon domain-containing protein [Chloroflexota bacterium]
MDIASPSGIGAVFFVLAVLTLVGMYVGQPFMQRRSRRAMQEDHEYSSLMAEYEQTVNALQELEFDNLLGKIPLEDYPRQRAALLGRGADLLRRLDEFSADNQAGKDAQERLEAAVAARRADASATGPTPAFSDEDLEARIAARRKARSATQRHKEKAGGFCPKCGKPILVSDRFCPACGKAVN